MLMPRVFVFGVDEKKVRVGTHSSTVSLMLSGLSSSNNASCSSVDNRNLHTSLNLEVANVFTEC